MKTFFRNIRFFEYGLLWFSIVLPIIGIVTFAFGGSCSLWQWWLAFAIVVLCMSLHIDHKEVFSAAVLMLFWFAMVWILCGILANPGGWDENAYHFPAVRLLADGWNPLLIRTPEAFKGAFGFAQGDMEIYHTLFQMKGIWIFNAIGSKFTNDFFSPMLPMTLVLFPAVALRLFRLTNDAFSILVISVLLFLLIPRSFYSIDAVLVLSTFALIACMFDVINGGKVDVFGMSGYTVLMASSKLNGMYQAAIIWMVFAVVVLIRRMPLKSIIVSVAIAVIAFVPLAVTPFITSILDYANPFHPHVSFGATKARVDICSDFEWKRNDDMKSLGHFESLVNAYISPALVQAFYDEGERGDNFCPKNQMFEHYPGLSADEGVSALHVSVRILFWLAIIGLCCFGGWSGVFVVAVSILGLIAVPTRMVGYVRYVPWMLAPLLFFSIVLICRCRDALRRTCAILMIFVAMSVLRPLSFQRQIYDLAWDINSGALARECLEDGHLTGLKTLYPPQSERWKASLELTRRRFPQLREAEVVDKWGDNLLVAPEWLSVFPCGLFGYESDNDLAYLRENVEASYPGGSRMEKFRFVSHTFFITVPRLVLRRIFQI